MQKAEKSKSKIVFNIHIENYIAGGSNNTVNRCNPVNLSVEQGKKSALSGLSSIIGNLARFIATIIAKLLMM